MLHKEIPFLRIGIPLCAGIISGLYFKPDLIFLSVTSALIISGFLISLLSAKYKDNILYGISFTFSLFICGLLLYRNEKDSLTELKPESSLFNCTVSDYPEEKEKSLLMTVRLNSKLTQTESQAIHGSMLLYIKKDSSSRLFLPGDNLIIKCTPSELTNKGNPYEFDYKFFMENLGVKYYALISNNDIRWHNVPDKRDLIHIALIIREKIIGMYKARGITGERLALVAAITLGEKSKLEQEQKQNFIKAGVMHIMAVSGLHAIILSLFIFNVLFFLKQRFNIFRVIITILFLWSFAFITGLTPSVLRATLMFTFIQAGTLMQRKVNGLNSVLASAFVLILLKPSVIFNAGFLLSYSAVIYIIIFYREFYLLLQFKSRLSDKIWQSAAVTLVAQAGTLPLTIMLFNRFPTYFILTNIIIVPLSSILIVIGCTIPILFPIRFLSDTLGLILNHLTGMTEVLTARAASLPFSTIENIGMTTTECILLIITLFFLSSFILKSRTHSILFPLSLMAVFLIAGTSKEIFIRKTNELIVYNIPGSSAIGIRTGKILNVYSDTILMKPEVIRHCATLGLKIKANLLNENFTCLSLGEQNILLCKSLNQRMIQNYSPDIVIITGSNSKIDKNLKFGKIPHSFIFSSSVSGFNYSSLHELSDADNIHFIRKSGAYIRRL